MTTPKKPDVVNGWAKIGKADLKYRMENAGSHWFDKETVKFFGTSLGQVWWHDGFDAYAWTQSDLKPHYDYAKKQTIDRREYWACWWAPEIGQRPDRLHTDSYLSAESATARLAKFLRGELATHPYFCREIA